MSQLVFLGNSGGSVTLTNADTASALNLTVPAANGTLLYITSSGLLTVPNLTVTGTPLFTGTSALGLPSGTGTQRPTTPVNGQIRYCTDAGGFFEGYRAGAWEKFTTVPEGIYTVNYLAVAGGGGGSNSGVGGGGAGGYLASSVSLTPGTAYTFIIGAGGASNSAGNNTTFTGVAVALAGGAPGGSGGSGGGGSGAGTSGQGNFGGVNVSGAGGGGGGAGASGGDATGFSSGGSGTSNGGNGGVGLANSITGSTIYYAGGGGGGKNVFAGPGGAGGNGLGGGNTANRGGGGGGSTVNPGPGPAGETGGSGIVILAIPTANYTGTVTGAPTVTTFGGNTIVQFTASGSYTA